MDSPLIGYKQIELIYIETEKFYFIIKGNYNESFSLKNDCLSSSLDLFCLDNNVVFEVFKPENQKLESFSGNALPLFFEYNNYQVIIESKCNESIDFYHENRNIRNQVTYTGRSKRILSGNINFGSDIGLTEIVIRVDSKDYLSLRLEIFPTKIDYKNDYFEILKDVNEEIYNLSFEFLRKTYLNTSLNNSTGNSLTEFFSILSFIYDNILQSIRRILKNPHHNLVQEKNILPYQKLKKCKKETIKWMEKNSKYVYKKEEKYIPLKALQVKKKVTLNTYENRFLRHMLFNISRKLNELKCKYLLLDRKTDTKLIQRIENMKNGIDYYLKHSFLSDVEDFNHTESFSLVLNMAPGYKEIFKYYLMLKKGLTLHGDIFKMSMKELSQLYEYWCFVKINSLLKRKYKLIQNNLLQINNNGVFVTLKKGVTTKVTYQNPKTGEIFEISYNMGMNSKTVPQKPDNVFSISKDDEKVKYQYILDAKYRLNSALKNSRYKKYYKKPGPEESDINTMHRYRDSIIHYNNNHYERATFGAFVLFPYKNEEEYRNHKFYKSIELVNVGGLPFLPGTTKIVEEFLYELIEESPLSSYERSLEQAGKDYYFKKSDFNKRNVLIGSLRSKQQLEFCLQHKFYHTPLKNVNLDKHLIKYIAIGQSKKQFKDEAGIRYYGKVKKIDILKRKDIKEIPKNSDDLYIKFEIGEWKKLDRPIRVEGYQVRKIMYTSEFLLKSVDTVTELCIKSKEEFRIWYELKRMNNEVEALIDGNSIHRKTNVKGFKFQDKNIFVFNNCIRVIKENKVQEFSFEDFRKRPKTVANFIKEM